MLPSLRNRLVITVAAAVGALIWLSIGGHLRAADGSTGLSLMTARHGPVLSGLLVLVVGLPAVLAGGLASAVGNPLSGVFVAAVALSVLVGSSGGMEGWVFRHDARLPDDYLGLIVEMMIWMVCVLGMLYAVRFVQGIVNWVVASHEPVGEITESLIRAKRLSSLAGFGVSAVVAGVVSVMLLRSPDRGQVICSLILAFFAGGLVATTVWPNSHPWAILMSPALVAIAAYGWVALSFSSASEFLQAWNSIGDSALRLPGPAVALPAHYASAAVVGCTLGIGGAQSMNRSRARLDGQANRE